jgi:hypothetical protein
MIFPGKVSAQATISCTKPEIRSTGIYGDPPPGYNKYFLCFVKDEAGSTYVYLSEWLENSPSVKVFSQAFLCPKGQEFQVRLVYEQTRTRYIAEAVSRRPTGMNEAIAYIR